MSDFPKHAARRFGQNLLLDKDLDETDFLEAAIGRASCRSFLPKAVPDQLIDALCAVALSAPSKSDLQQRDIIIVEDQAIRNSLGQLLGASDWAVEAPVFLVFCGNNKRQRQLHQMHDIPFGNDHFDPLFNAIGDAAIAMSAFVTAAETVGLGTCPISQIRNHPNEASDLLGLPDLVFPFVGLAVGWPATKQKEISPRLSLKSTVHRDQFDDDQALDQISEYDQRRRAVQPYEKQRHGDLFGESDAYCWSEEKARHYSQSERAGFGEFLRKKGFRLD
jgi:nitroreductase